MTFQDERGTIRWKMHFTSSPEAVYGAFATQAGRELYWAESSPESGDTITFIRRSSRLTFS